MKTVIANELFDTKAFAELLNKIGVNAKAEGQSLTFDAEALRAKKNSTLPTKVYNNKKWLLA